MLLIVNGHGDYFRNVEIRGDIAIPVSALISRREPGRTDRARRRAREFLQLAHRRG